MWYQTVFHEKLLKPCRVQFDNARCGEMISNTTHLLISQQYRLQMVLGRRI